MEKFTMVKSHVEELLHVYKCLFLDICNAYPCDLASLEKDLLTLEALASERGVNLFLVDLPAVGKHLDRCVSEGRFVVCGLPLTGRCPRRIMYPEFLKGLWGRCFDECGCLKEDCDAESLLFLRQVYYMAKKAEFECSEEAVTGEVRTFLQTDSGLPDPEEVWSQTTSFENAYEGYSKSSLYQERVDGHPLKDELRSFLRALDFVSGALTATLGSYDFREWNFKHGPGVIAERTGLVYKYNFVNWSPMLESAFPEADCSYHNYGSWARSCLDGGRTSEDPCSRLIAVPKTIDKPRLIAAEPSEHMWCQQNIWHYMRTRVHMSWIAKFVRFTDQTQNQEMCRSSSVTGLLATLDLSSASDRVTCQFVGNLFRANPPLLNALRACRTRRLRQTLDSTSSEFVELKKFSTMGSACTFPVESLGFASIAIAAVLTKRRMRLCLGSVLDLIGEVSVFGDDIIIPVDSVELCTSALEVLDFKVNTSKSFWVGNFRESCGVDSYKGTNVTPVYWRGATTSEPEKIVSTVEVRNSFYKKGFWAVAEYLTSTIPRQGLPTVRINSGVFGLESFVGPRISGFRRRYNVGLHREEVYVLTQWASTKILETNDESVLLQFFTEAPEPFTPWRGGLAQKPKTRLSMAWKSVPEVVS